MTLEEYLQNIKKQIGDLQLEQKELSDKLKDNQVRLSYLNGVVEGLLVVSQNQS